MPSTDVIRVTAVWSRDVNFDRLAGRTRIIAAIREVMSEGFHVESLRLQNVLEIVKSLLSGCRPSLQSLLFCDGRNHRRILRELEGNPPDVLYCDGVRT